MKVVNEFVEGNFAVELCEWEGFTLRMIRSLAKPASDPFLPASVSQGGKLLWEYARHHKGFAGVGSLFDLRGEHLIVLSTWTEVFEVIPVLDLPKMQRIGGVWMGGRDIAEAISLKKEIAERMRRQPRWTEVEKQMLQHLSTAAPSVSLPTARRDVSQPLAAARAAAEAKKAAARAEREAKRARINGRQRLFVFTATGDRRHGVPVVGDEWMVLQDGAFCVSVSSLDEATGQLGEVLESFAIFKKGAGNPVRTHVTSVFRDSPVQQQAGAINFDNLEVKVVPVGGVMQPVVVAKTMDDIRALRNQGLNSGTLAMCPKQGDAGRFAVFRLTQGKIEPVTEVMRRQQA